jgi:hypothetical protein
MYLWKYWRESRIVFLAGLLLIGLHMAVILSGHGHMTVMTGGQGSASDLRHPGVADDLRQVTSVLFVFFYVQIAPLGFFAWLVGSFGVGRDLGEGAGSFLFTRPRKRAAFVWSDWGCGMAEVVVMCVLANLAIWMMIHRVLLSMGDPLGGRVVFGDNAVPLSTAMTMSTAGGILIAGLIFSVTYASTVVMRHARGVILSIGLFVGYLLAGAVVHHYWSAVRFPDLTLHAFTPHGPNTDAGWEIAARVAVLLIFPLLAQFSLERAEL